MVRSTMASLIQEVRDLISDGAGSEAAFTDDEIQRFLDRNRIESRYCGIYGLSTIGPGGVVTYGTFDLGRGWETDISFVDSGYNVVTPDLGLSDVDNGRYVFDPPIAQGWLMASGYNYDIYGAAADLCEGWISQNKNMYSFTRGSRSYQRGQIVTALTRMRDNFRMKQRIIPGTMIRTDII